MTSRLHREGHAFLVAMLSLALGAAGLAGCQRVATPGNGSGGETVATDPCGTLAPDKSSTLPMDPGKTQTEVDCSAWQSFIALNWKGDPNQLGHPDKSSTWADFGTPGDTTPKVWEGYLEASGVFDPNTILTGMWERKRPEIKSLVRISKFSKLDLSAITQAGSGDHWLTNQRGDVTYYEVMINRDEFQFITTQKNFDLTTAKGQLDCATQPGQPVSDGPPLKPPYPPGTVLRGGLNMPAGIGDGWDDTDCTGAIAHYGDGVGAMEIKAAWTPLPADRSLDYRYKTALAKIEDPATHRMRSVTVGLVGMHIIRKRFPRLPWVWATFEQIDNSPDEAANGGFTPPALPANANQKPSPGFTFFNPVCDPKKDPTYQCKHNAPPVPCGTSGTVCDPYDKPMQITRLNPVGATANNVTAYVWGLLPAKSVFNYYRLVDVQWPQAAISRNVPGPGIRVPLTMGNPTPVGSVGGTSQIVANTTLESFQQSSNSCMDCHANFASIASPSLLQGTKPGALRKVAKPGGAQPPYASDYSFIFLSETRK